MFLAHLAQACLKQQRLEAVQQFRLKRSSPQLLRERLEAVRQLKLSSPQPRRLVLCPVRKLRSKFLFKDLSFSTWPGVRG